MNKLIVLGVFILTIMINATIGVAVPSAKVKTANEEIGGVIALFIFLLLSVYLVKFIYKKIVNFRINIPKDSNIFEIIFYSRFLGPFLKQSGKEKIASTKKGRVGIILYPIIYLIIGGIALYVGVEEGLDDDELTILSIFILLGLIPYKLLLPFSISIYNYVIGK